MTDKPGKPKRALSDDDIKTRRGIGRRSFLLGAFGGTTALAACVETTGPYYTGLTDSDGGPYADQAGYGRGGTVRGTGWTDSDSGPNADPANFGRGPGGRYTGWTDSDSGPYADAAGYGRG